MRSRLYVYPAAIILLLASGPAAAQLYRFTDSDGHTYFTDDPTGVPPEGRSDARQPSGAPLRPVAPAIGDAGPSEEDLRRLEILIREEDRALRNERIAIMNEKERLENERKRAETPEQIHEYNLAIRRYNDRIAEFLRRQSRLEDDRIEWQALRETLASAPAVDETPVAVVEGLSDVALMQRQKAMETEYEALMNEKTLLHRALEEAETDEALNALNARIADFNTGIGNHNEQQKQLEADIREYNKQMVAALTRRIQDLGGRAPADPGRDRPPVPADGDASSIEEQQARLDEQEARLNEEEARLAEEYARLRAEQQTLEQMRSNAETDEDYREYNRTLEGLNARIKAYEQRNSAFKRRLVDHNTRLRQLHERRLNQHATEQASADH